MLDCRQKSAARSTIKYNLGNPPETYAVAWCDDEYSAVFERVCTRYPEHNKGTRTAAS
jgi:hypothetical protein